MKEKIIDAILGLKLIILTMFVLSFLLCTVTVLPNNNVTQEKPINNLQAKKVWRIKEIKRDNGETDWIPILVDEDEWTKTT